MKPTKSSYQKKWLRDLKRFGVSEKDYDKLEETLTKRFGKKASEKDVIWGLYNNAVTRNLNDLHTVSQIYSSMALFIEEEGIHDPTKFYELSNQFLLKYYKVGGISEVRYLAASSSSRTCKACGKMDGKIFKINKILKNLPVPNKKCTNMGKGGKFRQCRCIMLAVTELG